MGCGTSKNKGNGKGNDQNNSSQAHNNTTTHSNAVGEDGTSHASPSQRTSTRGNTATVGDTTRSGNGSGGGDNHEISPCSTDTPSTALLSPEPADTSTVLTMSDLSLVGSRNSSGNTLSSTTLEHRDHSSGSLEPSHNPRSKHRRQRVHQQGSGDPLSKSGGSTGEDRSDHCFINKEARPSHDPLGLRSQWIERGRSQSEATIEMRRETLRQRHVVFSDDDEEGSSLTKHSDDESEHSVHSIHSAHSLTGSATSAEPDRYKRTSGGLRQKKGLPALSLNTGGGGFKVKPAPKSATVGHKLATDQRRASLLRRPRSLSSVMSADAARKLPKKKDIFKQVHVLAAIDETREADDVEIAKDLADLTDVLRPSTARARMTSSPNLQWHNGKLKPKHLIADTKDAEKAALMARIEQRKLEQQMGLSGKGASKPTPTPPHHA